MKLLLVINIEDDVADAYEDFTVDYDLRGTPKDDQKVNESIKYVEDCTLKPMPSKRISVVEWLNGVKTHEPNEYDKVWNDFVDYLEADE